MTSGAGESQRAAELLSAAQEYAANGWSIFPLYGVIGTGCSCSKGLDCTNPGKHPRTAHGLKDATQDMKRVADWFCEPVPQNLGIRTGIESGLLVLDTDGPEAEAFVQQLGLSPTRSVRTARGLHRYYQHPGDDRYRNSAGTISPKVDARGEGGYVVAPPSDHASGHVYQWLDPTTPIQPLPEALRNLWQRTRTAEAAASIHEGGRNSGLASHLGRLRQQGMGKEELMAAARVFNTAKNTPPLDDREVERVAKSIARYPSEVALLNETYACVIVGDKECVIEEGNGDMDIMSLSAFQGWFRGQTVRMRNRTVPVARVWLDAPFRRKFRRIDFVPPPLVAPPSVYNLFRGWPIPPNQAGSWALFKEHLLQNVCGGVEQRFDWVFGWFAQMFQEPAYKPGTALALRGPQGTGKTTVGEVFGHLAGVHHFMANSPHQVMGQFNAHLKSTVLLQAEEAFWAGDKAGEGTLKDLITNHVMKVEFKGKDIVRVRNCIRLLVTSNSEWCVPSSYGDRRFTVLDVGDARKNDHDFFGRLLMELKEGGYNRLMYDLLNHRYDEAFLRINLDTAAARDQKGHSLTEVESWIVDLVAGGFVPGDQIGLGSTLTRVVYGHYTAHAHRVRSRRVLSEMMVGKYLQKWFPTISKARRRVNEKLTYLYEFPPLRECREALQARFPGLDPGWNVEDFWMPDPTIPGDGDEGCLSDAF